METVAYRVTTNIKHRSKGKTSKQTNKQVSKQIARIAKPIPIVIENRDSHYILNVCPCVCLSVHICDILFALHLCPIYDVPDHTNHIFSESLSSGDDNDRDEDLQKDNYKDKDTQTHTKTETKCFQDLFYILYLSKAGSSRI